MFKATADQLARIKGAEKWDTELTAMANTSEITCDHLANETGPDTDVFNSEERWYTNLKNH